MKRSVLYTLILLAAAMCGGAQQPPSTANPSTNAAANKAVSKTPDGLAVGGYDVVSYFDQKRAMKGDPSFTATHDGATYRFVSSEHRELFVQDPDRYLPQYGGYCAYGTAAGHKAQGDPEAWTVIDGKLYLNYNKQVQKAFLKEPAPKLRQADANWEKLKQ